MTLALSIAAAIAVAITARLMYLFFLSGKTISNTTLAGRLVGRLWAGLVDFANGWSGQSFRYKLLAYPCMLVAMGLTSLIIYWLIPVINDAAHFGDKLRYCVLIVLAGVPSAMLMAFLLLYGAYLARSSFKAWWRGEGKERRKEQDKAKAGAEAAKAEAEPEKPEAAASDADGDATK